MSDDHQTTSLSTETPSQPLERRVSFNPNVRVLCVAKNTPTDTHRAWYTQEDFRRFKKDIKHTQRAWEKGRSLRRYCLRGIEHFVFPEWGDLRFKRRSDVLLHVLTAQGDSERMANALASQTEASFFEARMKALQDAYETELYLGSMSTPMAPKLPPQKSHECLTLKLATKTTLSNEDRVLHTRTRPPLLCNPGILRVPRTA